MLSGNGWGLNKMKRTVFFISDQTGITAEMLGHSLLTQFDEIEFEQIIFPFIDTEEKAQKLMSKVDEISHRDGTKPLLFVTIVDPFIREIVAKSHGLVMDLFNTFIDPLEHELSAKSSYRSGRSHGITKQYNTRIDAVNFTMSCDDGAGIQNYPQANIILIGVSRCGKTPTSLYLALQFGIYVANYPFTEEDVEFMRLPPFLEANRSKLFGLTIEPERLHIIRSERRPNSRYSSIEQCKKEINEVSKLFKREGINFLDTTTHSIEEISAKILDETGLRRSFY